MWSSISWLYISILVMLISPQSFIIYGINQDSTMEVSCDDPFLVIKTHSIIIKFYFSPLIKFGINTHAFASNIITLVWVTIISGLSSCRRSLVYIPEFTFVLLKHSWTIASIIFVSINLKILLQIRTSRW